MTKKSNGLKDPMSLALAKSSDARRAVKIVEEANDLKVQTQAQFVDAVEFRKGIKRAQAGLKGLLGPFVKDDYDHWQKSKARANGVEKPLGEALGIINGKIAGFNDRQEEVRRKQQAEKQKKADDQAEKDRKAEVKDLRKEGMGKEADRLEKKPVEAQAVAVAPPTPKVAGFGVRKIPKFDIEDEAKIPREFMTPDLRKIDAEVRKSKLDTSIPGVRVYMKTIPA